MPRERYQAEEEILRKILARSPSPVHPLKHSAREIEQ